MNPTTFLFSLILGRYIPIYAQGWTCTPPHWPRSMDTAGNPASADRLWGEHLGNLTKSSVDAFEAAMRLDDTRSDARFSHAMAKDLWHCADCGATPLDIFPTPFWNEVEQPA